MVSTILLKDTSDRTAYRVFEPGVGAALPGFGFANNLVLLPRSDELSGPALGAGDRLGARPRPCFEDGAAVPIDTRRVLQAALARLRRAPATTMQCGLEVEFHLYRLAARDGDRSLDPARAAWPGEPPEVTMIHPGYNLLAEGWADMADEPLRDRPRTAAGPRPAAALARDRARPEPGRGGLRSDRCAHRRRPDGPVPQRRAPGAAPRRLSRQLRLPAAVPERDGERLASAPVAASTARPARNAFIRDAPARAATPSDAPHTLSDVGAHYLAGLLAHGRAMAPFCAPTINAYGALPAERDGAAVGRLGPRQPRRDAARARPLRRRGDADREPHRRADGQSLPLHGGADPRRPRRHRAPPRRAAVGRRALRRRRRVVADEPRRSARRALRRRRARRARSRRRSSTGSSRIKRFELERHAAADDSDAWQAREYFSRF